MNSEMYHSFRFVFGRSTDIGSDLVTNGARLLRNNAVIAGSIKHIIAIFIGFAT